MQGVAFDSEEEEGDPELREVLEPWSPAEAEEAVSEEGSEGDEEDDAEEGAACDEEVGWWCRVSLGGGGGGGWGVGGLACVRACLLACVLHACCSSGQQAAVVLELPAQGPSLLS